MTRVYGSTQYSIRDFIEEFFSDKEKSELAKDPNYQSVFKSKDTDSIETQKQIAELPALDPVARRFQRLMIGYASDLELDSNGRILLPAPLREYAKLEKKLVLVGQVHKLELWAEDLWLTDRDMSLQVASEDGALPGEMLSLTL